MDRQNNNRYKPPIAQWVNIVRNGHILFRFDKIRGIVEIKNRGEWITIDLVAEAERLEQQTREVAL